MFLCALSLPLSAVLFVAADRSYSGVDLHSHTHSFSLSVSPLPCLSFFPLKRCCDTFLDHWNTRFDCIRLFSFHKGSTNMKILCIPVLEPTHIMMSFDGLRAWNKECQMLKHFPKFLVKFKVLFVISLYFYEHLKFLCILFKWVLEPTHTMKSFGGLQARNKECQMLQHFPQFLVKFKSVL